MRTITTILLLVLPCQVIAQTTPQEVIERAIEAVGGEKALNQLSQGGQLVGKNTMKSNKNIIAVREEKFSWKGDDYQKRGILYVHDQRTYDNTVYMVRNRSWVVGSGKVRELNESERCKADLGNYVRRVSCLICLRSEKFALLKLPDEKSPDGTPLVGVHVSRHGSPDVTLLFDKTTYLIHTIRFHDQHDSGENYLIETKLSHYERVGDLMVPKKVVSSLGGVFFDELEITHYRLDPTLKEEDFMPPVGK